MPSRTKKDGDPRVRVKKFWSCIFLGMGVWIPTVGGDVAMAMGKEHACTGTGGKGEGPDMDKGNGQSWRQGLCQGFFECVWFLREIQSEAIW